MTRGIAENTPPFPSNSALATTLTQLRGGEASKVYFASFSRRSRPSARTTGLVTRRAQVSTTPLYPLTPRAFYDPPHPRLTDQASTDRQPSELMHQAGESRPMLIVTTRPLDHRPWFGTGRREFHPVSEDLLRSPSHFPSPEDRAIVDASVISCIFMPRRSAFCGMFFWVARRYNMILTNKTDTVHIYVEKQLASVGPNPSNQSLRPESTVASEPRVLNALLLVQHCPEVRVRFSRGTPTRALPAFRRPGDRGRRGHRARVAPACCIAGGAVCSRLR